MLTKILSSESQSIQKANRRLPVVKFFKCAITFLVVVLLLAVSASAYTVSQDGLDTVYTFPLTTLDSILGTQPSEMQLTVNYQGTRLTQNGGVDYSNLTRYRHIVTRDNATQRNLIVYSSLPRGVIYRGFGSLSAIIYSDVDSESLTFDSSFIVELTVEIPNNTTNFIDNAELKMYLDDPFDPLMTIHPTIVSTTELYDSNKGGSYDIVYRYKLSYVVDFTPTEEVPSVSFRRFRLAVNSLLDNKIADEENVYFTQYSMGIGYITVRQLADEEVKQYYQAISAGNNDLKQYFGTVNQVDQEIINTQKDKISQVGSSTSQLGLTSQLEESLSGQFDISQEVDVLGNSAVLGSVSNFWDLVPWDSTFVTTAIGMVGSVALLSLILHAGERGLSLSHSSNNKNSNNRSNKNNNSSKKGSGG